LQRSADSSSAETAFKTGSVTQPCLPACCFAPPSFSPPPPHPPTPHQFDYLGETTEGNLHLVQRLKRDGMVNVFGLDSLEDIVTVPVSDLAAATQVCGVGAGGWVRDRGCWRM